MPYIPQEEREVFEPFLLDLFKQLKTNQDYELCILALAYNHIEFGLNVLEVFEKYEICGCLHKWINQIKTVGQYNYIVTRIIHDLINKRGLSYTNLNTACGVLEDVIFEFKMNLFEFQSDLVEEALGFLRNAHSEFYRTVVVPYEKSKIKQNGFISELDSKLY